jgi:putative oxidoreductase
MDLGLLVLRLVAGLALAAHGAQKLFGWFGGYGLAGTGGFMEQLGFHPGRRAAWMAGMAEATGGLLLALGAATPLAATLIVSVMLVAIVTVHWSKGYFNHNGGYELLLLYAITALSIVLAGPGRFSIDAIVGREYAGLNWTLASLLVGAGGAVFQIASRHREPKAEAAPSA